MSEQQNSQPNQLSDPSLDFSKTLSSAIDNYVSKNSDNSVENKDSLQDESQIVKSEDDDTIKDDVKDDSVSKQDLEKVFSDLFEKEKVKLDQKLVEEKPKPKQVKLNVDRIKKLFVEDPATLAEELGIEKDALTQVAQRAWKTVIGDEDDSIRQARQKIKEDEQTEEELETIKEKLQRLEMEKYEEQAENNRTIYKNSLKTTLDKVDEKKYPALFKAIKAGLGDGLVEDGFNYVIQDAIQKFEKDPNANHLTVGEAADYLEKKYSVLLSNFEIKQEEKSRKEDITLKENTSVGRKINSDVKPSTFEESLKLAKQKLGLK